MKVAIPGRAMKMQEHFGSGTAHLTPLLKHGKIPFNNIQIKPHIDYININNATQGSHNKEEQSTLSNKEWKKTAKLYKKELKSKGNIRPSTAVRQHVKKISEDFTMTKTKYENSVNTTSTIKTPEKKEKSPIKSASSNSSVSSVNPKIPQSKFPKNVLSKITCSKCETISKASRKNVMSPINLPSGTGVNKNGVPKNLNTKCTNMKNKNSINSHNSNSRSLQELSPQKKLVGPTDISPRPRLRHSSGRCGGGTGAFDFCLAPTSPGPPRSPGRKLSSSLAGISPRSQQVCSEQIRRVKLFTERAILEGRVFSIFGYFPAVKDALRRRGWVEKVQHTVPYINPHPNNCVCPHVGYQLSFMSPLSAPSTNLPLSHLHPHHKTSGSMSKGNGEEIKDEQNQEEEEDTEVHPATADDDDSPSSAQTTTVESSPSDSVNIDISHSSASLSVPSSHSSSPLESDKEQRITANLGSSTVETLVPPLNRVNENKNPTVSDNQSDNQSSPDDTKLQESEKSSSNAEEPSDSSPDAAKNSDHFNTAILGPSEIRKGIAESITERNAPIFKYSTANIATKKSLDNSKDDDDKDCSPGEANNEEDGSQGENANDCLEGEKKGSEETEEEKPEPYNPYVEYELTDSDLPLVARLLRNVEPNFLWTWTRDSISFKHLSREQLVNRFPNTPFTTKVNELMDKQFCRRLELPG
ncbi:probable serine/threonine-protein kinase nek3 [Palaemon carinicauda]|uniref:probable serine/threonine-protein kinase nek3 n=1 Tax=Palaemon carinicauda TaxID=392227 RepID=UPI0035B655D4